MDLDIDSADFKIATQSLLFTTEHAEIGIKHTLLNIQIETPQDILAALTLYNFFPFLQVRSFFFIFFWKGGSCRYSIYLMERSNK